MKIDRTNYEEFFINYLDGRLTDSEIVDMENFLLRNPDLHEELKGLGNIVLEPDHTGYPDKFNLKQIDLVLPVTSQNFDYFCIASAEGDLNPDQIKGLQQFLMENPGSVDDLDQYTKLYLSPELSLNYPNKFALRKSIFVTYRREMYTAISIAAGIALLAGVYFGFVKENIALVPDVAVVNGNGKAPADTSVVRTADPTPATEKEGKEKSSVKPAKSTKKESAPSETGKPSSNGISFHVDVPVASLETPNESPDKIDEKQLLSSADIDRNAINKFLPSVFLPGQDKLAHFKQEQMPREPKATSSRNEYLTVEQFAKQKFSSLVFGKGSGESLSVWNVVTAGIDKVNDITGANLKLEREMGPEGETRALIFDSKLLKINAPVNKDE